jgi:hypothetical protein
MTFFWSLKPKTTTYNLILIQLDRLFSSDFRNDETAKFSLMAETKVLPKDLNIDRFLLEKQRVVFRLFEIALNRNIPHEVFVADGARSALFSDERYNLLDTETYSRCLSRAEKSGVSTFDFISDLFLSQLGLQKTELSDYIGIQKFYKNEFTVLYKAFEQEINKYNFTPISQ